MNDKDKQTVDQMLNHVKSRKRSKPMYGGLLILGTVVTCFAAWVTHVVVSISTQQFVLLIAGTIMFPIGIIHGIGSWFGVF